MFLNTKDFSHAFFAFSILMVLLKCMITRKTQKIGVKNKYYYFMVKFIKKPNVLKEGGKKTIVKLIDFPLNFNELWTHSYNLYNDIFIFEGHVLLFDLFEGYEHWCKKNINVEVESWIFMKRPTNNTKKVKHIKSNFHYSVGDNTFISVWSWRDEMKLRISKSISPS